MKERLNNIARNNDTSQAKANGPLRIGVIVGVKPRSRMTDGIGGGRVMTNSANIAGT